MPLATVLKSSTYRRMPWKNGGGETVEIAISPEGAVLSEFDWRVSMATVATDGPFSSFPEIDRTLSILDGKGMSLAIGAQAPILLTQSSAPLAFPADVPVSATLAAGTITDLNVMTRRGRLLHHVERVRIDDHASVGVNAETWLMLCHEGCIALDWGAEQAELIEGDTLLLQGAEGATATLTGNALCYIIAINGGKA
jgi:environmental stress-induced protein Ves